MTKADKEGQRKAPILRFKGFTDDWEQRKLSELTQQVKRTRDSENPILTISAKNGWIDQKDRFNRVIAGKELKNYIELYENELSYNHGNSKYAKFGIIYVQRKYKKALVPKVYHSFSMTNGDPRFIENLSLGHKLDKELSKLITSGARQDGLLNINKNSFYSIKLFIPSEQEQIKISNIMDILNHIITLYENKRKLLTALFQGLSQYLFIFSKEKNAIQMSLSSITLSETKGIAKENSLSSGNIEYLDTTRLNGGKAKLVSGKKDVDFRDIIVLWDGSNAGKIYYGFSGILGSTLKVFKLKDDINSEYVYYYLKFKQNLILHKFRTPNIPHVSKDFSQRFTLPIPSKERQNLIANILHLNELQINLINKKIEKLKQIKKSLLQNIFL